jgi:hypothetical protein
LGIPCRLTILSKYILAYRIVGYIVWTGMKCADLVRRSIITQIESNPFEVLGKPTMKSILISSHFQAGMGKGYNSLADFRCTAFTL